MFVFAALDASDGLSNNVTRTVLVFKFFLIVLHWLTVNILLDLVKLVRLDFYEVNDFRLLFMLMKLKCICANYVLLWKFEVRELELKL
jgi:hypothetical protein